jgi:hypothetical protein
VTPKKGSALGDGEHCAMRNIFRKSSCVEWLNVIQVPGRHNSLEGAPDNVWSLTGGLEKALQMVITPVKKHLVL